jgi:hypothetical protein
LRAKEREITVAELDVRGKNREVAQLEKQKAAADLAKATEEVKAATSDKDKEAAAQHRAEAHKNLAQTVTTASKETVKEEKKAEAATAAMAIFSTYIRTDDGLVKIVPNDNIWKNVIINETTGVVKAPPAGDAKPPEGNTEAA